MTTVPVKDIGSLMPYVTEAGGAPSANGEDFMNKFKSAVESQAAALNAVPVQTNTSDIAPAQETRTVNDVNKTPESNKDREPVENSIKRDTSKAEKGKASAEDAKETTNKGETNDETETVNTAVTDDTEITEAVSTAIIQIVDQVAQELNVEPEEIIDTLDEMGLEMKDLLDPTVMTELVTTLAGEQDTVTLLTDENLYQTLGNLQDYVVEVRTDLMDKLDLSQEALNEVLAQTEELIGPVQTEDTDPVPEEAPLQNLKENPLEGMKDYKVSTVSNGDTITMDVKVDDATGAQIVTNVSRENETQSDSRESSQHETGHEDRKDHHPETPLFTQTQQFNTEINTNAFTAPSGEAAGFRTEASDIANQIMENMRANLKPEVTELEMNLHPASLGNVRVNLQAQNGQITAQFFAQNEAVRAAIESQVTQLRESLESQGIKIEQVEVAVSSQGFDRNRDNNGGQNGEQAREQNEAGVGRAGKTRRIDLNAMEGEELEDMDEADKIAAEIMAHNGNTVDYMA